MPVPERILLSSFTTDTPVLLYLGFGVCSGLGVGFAYNAVMSSMSRWFPDKQGLISGVMLMGFGLSSFLVGKLFVAVTPETDPSAWRITFRVLGIVIFLGMFLCGIFFQKPAADFKPPVSSEKIVKEPALDIDSKKMLKKSAFWYYYVWTVVISAAGLVLVSQANGIAAQVGTSISASAIATVVGLVSIMNGIGRVIFGGLFDKKGHRFTMILDMILFLAAGLILIAAIRTNLFPLIIAGFLTGGFAYGGVTPTNSAIISDFFGRTHYPVNFSIINTNLIIASFASTIAGKLYDASGSYLTSLFLIILLTVLGFVALIGVRRPAEKI